MCRYSISLQWRQAFTASRENGRAQTKLHPSRGHFCSSIRTENKLSFATTVLRIQLTPTFSKKYSKLHQQRFMNIWRAATYFIVASGLGTRFP
jgi:hypothetical protein